MEVLFGKFMATLLLPPGLNLAMVLCGMLLRQRFYRTGTSFIYAGFILLYLFSMPIFSGSLVRFNEDYPALDIATVSTTGAKVIVVLGGGRYPNAPEYREDTVSKFALERIRYGAYLQRKTKLPILLSGGSVYGEQEPEAVLMKRTLENAFIGVAHWVEGKSQTTYQNALYTQEMLAKEKINNIILVTHAVHMTRSVEAFEKMGFTVTPAPLGFNTLADTPIVLRLLPNAASLASTSMMFHEIIGRLWYKLRYYR